MNGKLRFFLYIFVGASILAMAVLLFTGLTGKDGKGLDAKQAVLSRMPELSISDVRYTGSRDGEKLWELKSELARRERGAKTIELDGVDFTRYEAEGGDVGMSLTSTKGTYYEAGGIIVVSGSVRVTSKDGFTLSTERLKYDLMSGLATTRAKVLINVANGVVVKGKGLNLDSVSGDFSVLSNVQADLDDFVLVKKGEGLGQGGQGRL